MPAGRSASAAMSTPLPLACDRLRCSAGPDSTSACQSTRQQVARGPGDKRSYATAHFTHSAMCWGACLIEGRDVGLGG